MVISWHWSQYWVLTFLSQLMGPNFASNSSLVIVFRGEAKPIDNDSNRIKNFILLSAL